MNLDLISESFSKSKTYHQALLYAKIHELLKDLVAKENPQIMPDLVAAVVSLKLNTKVQVAIFSSNPHFLTWLQTEVDLVEILSSDLKAQKLLKDDQELVIKFRLG